MDDQNKNLILASLLSFVVIMAWYVGGPMVFPDWFPKPEPVLTAVAPDATATAPDAATAPAAESGTTDATTLQSTPLPEAPRVAIETPKLQGSISTLGGRLDDLSLKTYHLTPDTSSETVRLLSPVGKDKPYYAVFGWSPGNGLTAADVPGAKTEWAVAGAATLTPDQPVTLTWDNGKGLMFTRTIAVDKNFMFKVSDVVENNGATEARLAPYGIIARHGLPKLEGIYVVHEGVIRRTDGEYQETNYPKVPGLPVVEREAANAARKRSAWSGNRTSPSRSNR